MSIDSVASFFLGKNRADIKSAPKFSVLEDANKTREIRKRIAEIETKEKSPLV